MKQMSQEIRQPKHGSGSDCWQQNVEDVKLKVKSKCANKILILPILSCL